MPTQTFFNLPDARRQTITDAAITEFANHSYEAASISRIVSQTKIAKGSFYQYFKDKQDLYLYLVDWALEVRRNYIMSANLPDIQDGFFVYLRALFQANLEFQLANPAFTQILFRGPHFGDVPFREEVFKRTKAGLIEFMRHCVQNGINEGQLSDQINPDIAAIMIVTLGTEIRRSIPMILGIDTNQLIKDSPSVDKDAISKIIDDFVNILERGIGGSND